MSLAWLSISLSVGICVYVVQNFDKYEKNYPNTLFQIGYAFLIYFNYFSRVKDQKMNKFKFIFICLLKRFNKFVFFSFLYFQTPIHNVAAFIINFYYMIGVGFIFVLVPFKTWEYMVNRFFPFRFIMISADMIFISSDMLFIWNQTVENPEKVAIFNKPEHEYLFFAFFMGTMSFLQDCIIQTIRDDELQTIGSAIQSALNWGVGGLLGYLGFTYHYQIQQFLKIYGFHIKQDEYELMKIIFFVYYCILAGFYAQLPKNTEYENEQAKIQYYKNRLIRDKKMK